MIFYENPYEYIISSCIHTKYEDHGKKKKTETFFFQKNQLGSITAITDEKGKLVEEYRYDAFGKAYIRDKKSDEWREFQESKTGNSRLFTGREYDGETGLYYYRARYYSSELGRFISRDPIGTSDNINLYSYVGESPVGFVDPMGREKVLLAINETVSAYQKIIMGSLGSISNYSLYFHDANLTKSEYEIYNNFSIFELNDLDNNRDLTYDNSYYNAALNATLGDVKYQSLLKTYKTDNNMMQQLGWDSGNNNYADTLRHAYFNALNTNDFGVDLAKQMGNAHEFFDGNVGHTAIMDLYNNSIGRSIYAENKDASDSELMQKVVSNNNLLVYGYGDDTTGQWEGNFMYQYVASQVRMKIQNNLNMTLLNSYFQ